MRRHTALTVHPRRDPRRYRFALPNTVWECKLRPAEFMALSFLCCYRSQAPSLDTVSNGIHLTASTVKKHVAALRAKRLVNEDLSPADSLRCASGEFFTLPREIFLLELSPSAFVVYAYLLYNEDRRTHQCYPSYNSIAGKTGMAKNTVMRCVGELLDRGLISVKRSSYYDGWGMKWNGNNCYTILPMRPVMDEYHRRELRRMELDMERERARRQQEEYDRRHPRAPLCEAGMARPDPCPSGDREAAEKALRGTLGLPPNPSEAGSVGRRGAAE